MRPNLTALNDAVVAPDGPPLILASGSSARSAMLRRAGVSFSIVRPDVDEETARNSLAADDVTTEEAAAALARLKASRGSGFTNDANAIVLGADQLLEFQGHWLGKAADRAAAAQRLQALAGKSHRLVSSVVAFRGGREIWHDTDIATLTLRRLTPKFIEHYLNAEGEDILTSVGCYRIEGKGVQLMDRVEGDHFTILGLPLLPLLRFLRDQGVLNS